MPKRKKKLSQNVSQRIARELQTKKERECLDIRMKSGILTGCIRPITTYQQPLSNKTLKPPTADVEWTQPEPFRNKRYQGRITYVPPSKFTIRDTIFCLLQQWRQRGTRVHKKDQEFVQMRCARKRIQET